MITSLLSSLAAVLATWCVLGVAVAGLGLSAQRLVVGVRPSASDVPDAVWLGYAALLLALQVWHLVLPVNEAATLVFIAAGWASAFVHRRALREAWKGNSHRGTAIAIATGVAIWVALRGMGVMTLYDSGMYHVPFVEWAKAYPIVPGLGNLHGRLAFNSASLLAAAMLDQGPWSDGSQHVSNGFLVALFSVSACLRAVNLRPPRPIRARVAFELTMAPAILATAFRQDVRSLSTDLPVLVLLAAAGGMLFELLAPNEVAPDGRRAHVARLLAVLGAAAVVKLSAAPFAAVAVFLVLVTERPWRHVLSARLLALPALSSLVWMIRGAVLSGYPLYPSRILSLPFDWRVNAEQAAAEAGWISMSARNLNNNVLMLSNEWVPRWLEQVFTRGDLFHHFFAPLIIAIAASAAILWQTRRRPLRPPWSRGLLVGVPVVASLAFWWLTAPHTRLAQGPVWILASAVAACAIGGDVVLTSRRRRTLMLASLAVFLVLGGRVALGDVLRASPQDRGRAMIESVLTLPASHGWFVPTPTPDLLDDVTPSGLHLAVPRVDNSCWNGPLLCTPHPTTHLAMRQSGNLAAGFRMEGAWEPEWFPNPWIPFLPYWRCLQNPSAPTGALTLESDCRRFARAGPLSGPR